MKNNKKTLKGFTLVELIIVVSIFALIMTMVMSFLDPVSTLMKKTSLRERTAAYSDNIEEYLDNSLHYASQLYVYDGGYLVTAADAPIQKKYKFMAQGDADWTNGESMGMTPAKSAMIPEVCAVAGIVANNFDGAVNSSGDHLTGKVNVLKLKNSENGMITETTYNFTAGDTLSTVPDSKKSEAANLNALLNANRIEISEDVPEHAVINPEHTRFYNFFYALGNYKLTNAGTNAYFNAAGTEMSSVIASARDQSTAYCALRAHNIMGGADIGASNLPIAVVAYSKEDSEMIRGTHDTGSGLETAYIFKQPAHMNTVSMALTNALKFDDPHYIQYYRTKWKLDETDASNKVIVSEEVDNGRGTMVTELEAILSNSSAFNVSHTRTTKEGDSAYDADVTKDDIYIVYVLPYQINDTVVRH